jgi:hypothetical protein
MAMRWLAALLLGGLGLLAWASVAEQAPQISVENRTGLAVTELELVLEDQRARLDPLGGYDLLRQSIPLRSEGPVRLRVRFENETERLLDAGWFVPAQAGVATFVLITPDSLLVEQR